MFPKDTINNSLSPCTVVKVNSSAEKQIKELEAEVKNGNFIALTRLTSIAKQEPLKAAVKLGWIYLNGTGVIVDHTAAKQWFQLAARNGSIEALFYLGYCYSYGYGVEPSNRKAALWFLKAAFRGDANAVEKIMQLSQEGDASAIWVLGQCYLNGWGVEKGKEAAEFLFDQAKQKGSCKDFYKISKFCEKNNFIGQSEVCRIRWLKEATKSGSKEAFKELKEIAIHSIEEELKKFVGQCYLRGWGVAKDDSEAVKWLQLLCSKDNSEVFIRLKEFAYRGNKEAYHNLGKCYRNGWGVQKDDLKALFWLKTSVKLGFSEAFEELVEIANVKKEKELESFIIVCFLYGWGVQKYLFTGVAKNPRLLG